MPAGTQYLQKQTDDLDLQQADDIALCQPGLTDPVTGEPDPSAYLRMYRDARQVETTHCYVGRRWQDVVGMYPPPRELISHRMRMNTFLGKWLEYLADRGHGLHTLVASDVDTPAVPAPLVSVR